MSRGDIKKEAMKKEIGGRFKEFRQAINKNQYALADELDVHQSSVTNIEKGKTFPVAYIQHYLHHRYNLNTNWLYNEKEDMFSLPKKKSKYADLPLLLLHLTESDPMFEKMVELISLMRIPFVKQIIFGKLEEIKIIAKEEINSFLEKS